MDPRTVFHFLCTRLVTTSRPLWRYRLGPQDVGSSVNCGSLSVSTARGPRMMRRVRVGTRSSTPVRRMPTCTLRSRRRHTHTHSELSGRPQHQRQQNQKTTDTHTRSGAYASRSPAPAHEQGSGVLVDAAGVMWVPHVCT